MELRLSSIHALDEWNRTSGSEIRSPLFFKYASSLRLHDARSVSLSIILHSSDDHGIYFAERGNGEPPVLNDADDGCAFLHYGPGDDDDPWRKSPGHGGRY
jgi:hypothetical protein